jgi:hypothetical protein
MRRTLRMRADFQDDTCPIIRSRPRVFSMCPVVESGSGVVFIGGPWTVPPLSTPLRRASLQGAR